MQKSKPQKYLIFHIQLKTSDATNAEHENEKKAETEEFEKKLGLLTYLGGSVVESKGKTNMFL